MVAGLTIGRKKYAAVEAELSVVAGNADVLLDALSRLVERDAEAYSAVSEAYKLPKEPAGAAAARADAIEKALLGAAEVPLETARLCVQAATLAATAAAKGNPNAITDAGVAALLAQAGCKGALYNVRANIASLVDRSVGSHLEREAAELLAEAGRAAETAGAAVERALTN